MGIADRRRREKAQRKTTILDTAFAFSLMILIIAGIFSLTRGKEDRSTSAMKKSTALMPIRE